MIDNLEFLLDNSGLSVRSNLLIHHWAHGLGLYRCSGDFRPGFHHVLRVLIPEGFVPFTLYGLRLSRYLNGIVFDRATSVLIIDFFEPLNYVLRLQTPQWLIFNVAVDVGARNVWVIIASQVNFQLQIRVLFEKLSHFWRFERSAHSLRRPSKIAEVKSNIFELWNTSRNHI